MDEFMIIMFHCLGYETTSNALAFTSYLLAIHPEEQEKLYAEINQYYSDHPVSTYTTIILIIHTYLYKERNNF